MQTFENQKERNRAVEKWACLLGGGSLFLYGLKRRSWAGAALAVLGSNLLYRGATGKNIVPVPIRPAGPARESKRGVKIAEVVTVNRPAADVYAFWRDFENLPKVMTHLESVTPLDEKLSHWVVKGPLGTTVEWDAEIINDFKNELITWQSLENADVVHAGSVSFKAAPGGRGTEVRVILRYAPPAGGAGRALASLLSKAPSLELREDLRRFKEMLEASEIPTA